MNQVKPIKKRSVYMYTPFIAPRSLSLMALLSRLLRRLLALDGTVRSKARLARLDRHMLRDIGLTEEEAKSLSQRPEWDAPAHWHR